MPIFNKIISSLSFFEKLYNQSFVEKRHTEYFKYIEIVSIKTTVMVIYCNQSLLCCYSRKYLDTNCIFRNSTNDVILMVLKRLDKFVIKITYNDPIKCSHLKKLDEIIENKFHPFYSNQIYNSITIYNVKSIN